MQVFKSWIGLSKQVNTTEYSESKKTMIVEFAKGDKYEYSKVPVEVWLKSLDTESIGRFINTDIKPFYSDVKLT
jgi:hypothetical protein